MKRPKTKYSAEIGIFRTITGISFASIFQNLSLQCLLRWNYLCLYLPPTTTTLIYIFCECKKDRCATGTSTVATSKTLLVLWMTVAFHQSAEEKGTWCRQLHAVQYAFLTLRATSILSTENILYLSAAGPYPCGPAKQQI